jgi:hypothetical protein
MNVSWAFRNIGVLMFPVAREELKTTPKLWETSERAGILTRDCHLFILFLLGLGLYRSLGASGTAGFGLDFLGRALLRLGLAIGLALGGRGLGSGFLIATVVVSIVARRLGGHAVGLKHALISFLAGGTVSRDRSC